MSKHEVAKIIDLLTPAAIARKMNVSLHAVRYAKTEGLFPASWYAELKSMCEAVECDCPMSLFNWRRSDAAGSHCGVAMPAPVELPPTSTPTEDAA